jgi:hypothetical protein
MSDDKLFFREGYTREEKIERIKANIFTNNSKVIREISDLGEDPSDYSSKQSILDLFDSKLDNSRYDEIIDNLFDNHGQKGDRFNIKLFEAPSVMKKDKIITRLIAFSDKNLGENLEYVNYSLEIENWKSTSQTIDVRFIASGSYTDTSDNLVVRTDDGEMQPIEEVTSGEIVEKEDTVVETRLYCKSNTMAIYNSGVNKSLKKQIALFFSGGEE